MQIITLKNDIKRCTVCVKHLPLGPRPIAQFSANSKILLVGQAPGRRVHETGIPFNDPSGDRLRLWLGVNRDVFYDDEIFAIVPMGFCFPGTGKSGDLPPRPECAITWREKVLQQLNQLKLTVVIGRYALDYHLPETQKLTVTQAVASWQDHWPDIIPLPHPSPRNNRWLKNNFWFETEVVPEMQRRVKEIIT
ncbi:IclR family transcriptional regulator [Candidatus Endobugula sertula]|uniref:IclR family transcriptional regulator n=1 Tax=Candidatus Endobugula sertula TaxID=62101 RepID=A0A1D2QSN4_9GAMM|nr:IclR family transcriptional regulator [Candidatus Endobugula sertula]